MMIDTHSKNQSFQTNPKIKKWKNKNLNGGVMYNLLNTLNPLAAFPCHINITILY